MNMYLPDDLVQEVATDMSIHPSFVEKDWIAVYVMKIISSFDGVVLGGGTSLSKGYKLIKRFSEDLDFKIIRSDGLIKSMKREMRHSIIDKIKSIDGFSIGDVTTRNEGNNCCFDISYENICDIPDFLRRNLQVELYFEDNAIGYEKRSISSFVAEYIDSLPEVSIDCIIPFYTAADKFNALMWRLFKSEKIVDYTLLRHLHDLCAVSDCYKKNMEEFIELVLRNFEKKDRKRISGDIKFADIARHTYEKLKTEPIYKREYEKYVLSVCYTSDEEMLTYDKAMDNLSGIVDSF